MVSLLFEGVDLLGVCGVLVNIMLSCLLCLLEMCEVMNMIKSYVVEDVMVIFGVVYDDVMGDVLCVMVVVMGLGCVVKK